jgi:hypothetical protein
MTSSLEKKVSPISLREKEPKQTTTLQNFLFCLHYHPVPFLRILLLDCVYYSPVCQYWCSSAQLSPTSSVETPPEPHSYCKLLIL